MPLARRAVSRRAFIAGGVAAAGLGTVVGWRGLRATVRDDPGPTPAGSPSPSPRSSPAPTASPSGAASPRGELRLQAVRSLSLDTFDTVRSGERSLADVLSFTHSRVVAWDDPSLAALAGDLASDWEQPDTSTLVFSLSPAANWSERPGLPARRVVAGDVAAHLERVMAAATAGQLLRVQRPWDYARIRRVDAPDDATLVIETHAPDPFLLQTLAGPFAFIQRPEAVPLLEADGNALRTEHVAGSGPFSLDGQDGDGDLTFSPAPGAQRAASIAALRLRPASLGLDALLAGELDEFIARDRRDMAAARAAAIPLDAFPLHEPAMLMSSLHVGGAPWSSTDLRLAVSAALNRYQLSEHLFGGRADVAGLVPPSAAAFARAPGDLEAFPGYRSDPSRDMAEARARVVASGFAGPITLDVPVIVDPLYAISDVVPALLREALGVEVVVHPESYVNIARKVSEGAYGNGALAFWIGWGPPVTNPDPSLGLWESLHSSGASAREAGFADAGLDRSLDRLVSEFDLAARRELVRDIEASVLSAAAGGLLHWVQQRHEVFRAPYVQAPPPDTYGLARVADRLAVDDGHAAYPVDRPR